MAFYMKPENRKRMKMVAMILGTITLVMIVLAIYNSFIAGK